MGSAEPEHGKEKFTLTGRLRNAVAEESSGGGWLTTRLPFVPEQSGAISILHSWSLLDFFSL
jgi:hypothetical protein